MKVKSFLKKYKNTCKEARVWMRENNIQTMEEAWKACEQSEWMIWVLRKLNCADKRTWVKIALACAKRVLSICEQNNSDAPRNAIKAAERWIKDPSEENRMKCQIAAVSAANAASTADAAYAYAAAAAAYAAAGAAAAADAYADAVYAAYVAAYAAAADERKAQCPIIRRLVKNPFI